MVFYQVIDKYDHDPWGENNNFKWKNNKNKQEQNNHNLYYKIYKFGFFKKKTNINNISNKKHNYISLITIAILAIWFCSGFYTIRESDRGVVLRFGKLSHLVYPGLNWRPTFIDTVTTVNVESVRELATSGIMLTSDENIVRVEMNIQYRIINPVNYLFNVTNADDSLRQATDSALRGVIGQYTMDRILTEGRTLIRNNTQQVLEDTIHSYNMGIRILDVNFQTARPPEEVKEAFDDAIAARENEQQYIREAEAYANEVKPRAQGQAERILLEGYAYKASSVLEAQGEIQRFIKLLPQYNKTPEIIRQRLYIETMEYVLKHSHKILVNDNYTKLLMFPIEKILDNDPVDTKLYLHHKKQQINKTKSYFPHASSKTITNDEYNKRINKNLSTIPNKKQDFIEKILNERRIYAQRDHITRDRRHD